MATFVPSTPVQQHRSALVALSTVGAVNLAQSMSEKKKYDFEEMAFTLVFTAVTALFTQVVSDKYQEWKERRPERVALKREARKRFQLKWD